MLPIEVRGVTLSAAGDHLLDGVNLTLEAGAFTVIMGPNGAGKSVLMRLLHGLIEPSAGTITFAGRAMSTRLRERQAMVFQRPVLLRRSTGENLEFALRLQGTNTRARRDELLTLMELQDKVRLPARLLSGGEQQRLALARALAVEPDVLFLDEPTASLDPASALLIEKTVLAAHGRGTKVIMITHDLGQAKRLADEVVFLHHGRVSEHSQAASFFVRPTSRAAIAYVQGRIVL